MRKWLLYLFSAISLMLLNNIVLASIPNISYSQSTNIYTVNTGITILTPTNIGGAVSAISFGTATALTGATLNNPRGVAIDASGNIYVANSGNNTISKYNSIGTYISTFGTGATMSLPKDLVFDSSGNAYVLNLGTSPGTGSVYKYNSSGVYQSTILSGLNYALGITIDASDNIYIADQGATTVKKYSTSGTLLLSLPTANLNTPLGVAVDASGNIYVVNNGSGNVTKYNSSGTFQSTFLSGYTSPQAITIDGAGNIYIGDNSTTNTVYVYNQSGTLLTSKVVTDPEGIAIDSKGDIFTAAYYASLVNEYKPTGGYFLNKTLPAGLSFDSSTGNISGTPTATMATTVYTITAYNSSGSATTTVSITVNPGVPTGTGGVVCGSGTVTLTASGSSPAGGAYNWYAALSGGASLGTGTTYTTPNLAATTTYYVDYTVNSITSTPRTAVTATVNTKPVLATAPTSPTGSLYLSYPFTGNANDVSGNSNNGTLQNAPSLTADRFGNANSAYSFNGTSQYISTATAVVSPGPQNFSISVWFKTSSAGGKLVGFSNNQTGSSTTYDRHIYMSNSGQIYFGVWPATSSKTINTISTYADGNWHHAVATLSTTNGANLYVDGALMATDATITSSGAYSGYWIVGSGNLGAWPSVPSNWYFTGSLDDIAVYNIALTASQVYTLYGGGSAPVCSGSTLSLQANTVSGATYSWSGPGSFTSALQNPTVSSTAITAMAGTYTCTVTGANGCTSQLSVTAVVNAPPSTTFTTTSSVNINSNATITYTGTDPSTSTYSWNFNGGTPATGTGQGPFSVQWATSGTKTITLNITNASGCSSSSTQNVTVSLSTYGNYAFGETVTLNTTTLGMTSNLTNFPALLSIQDNNLIIAGTCADKVQNPTGPNYDFAFVSAGSELYYQVESYNQTTGTLLVWVQIPSLNYAANNIISFYLGSKSPTVTHNAAFFANTWASDYQTVYHFNEGSTSATILDATSNGKNAAQTNTALATGKITGAYLFDGINSNILSTSNAFNITGSFTLSAWVNSISFTGYTDQKVLTNQSSYSLGGYKLSLYGGSAATMYDEVETRSATGTVSLDRTATGGTALTSGTWHYIQGIYDSSTSTFYSYLDGKLDRSLTGAVASGNNGSNLFIGSDFAAANWFYGIIDEARISNVAKSADWINAEYKNQSNPIAFTTGGSVITNTTNATAIPGALTYTWTGATNTDPSVATNWNNTTAGTTNQLPAFNGSASLVIPSGLTNYPLLTANAGVYGLTIASGATLNLNGYTLSVGCNIYNSSGGQILYGTNNLSGITWNGSAATQTYAGTNTSNTASLGTMIINNSSGGTVTISSGPVNIYNALTIIKGNLAIGSSPGLLTLKSTSTLTANVTAIPSTSSITGNVSVERYISGGSNAYRGYRLLSSPIYTASSGSNYYYDLSYLSSYAPITGSTGTSGGFTQTGNPSMALFRDNIASVVSFYGGNYRGITQINNSPLYAISIGYDGIFNLHAGTGFIFFYRGDLTNLSTKFNTTTVAEPNVFVSTGTLNQQAVTVINWYTGLNTLQYSTVTGNATNKGFNLVGNPYASSIDWNTYSTTNPAAGIYGPNVGSTIWVYNTINKAYAAYNSGIGTNGATNIIASGQGFFVQANATGAQLIFNESAKTNAQLSGPTQATGSTLLLSNAPVASTVLQYLRLELEKDSINKEDMVVRFSNSAKNNFVVNEDSQYISGSGSISLYSTSTDNVALAINNIPLPKQSQTVKLNVSAIADGTCKLDMTEINAIPNLYDIWLMDAYKKDSLDIKHNSTYIFQIAKSDTNSYGSNRFSLVIRQNPQLGIHLLDFTATKANNGAQIVWKTENEENYTYFTVEKSTDNGANFSVLGGFVSNAKGTYSYLDKDPLQVTAGTAANMYRLKIEDLNGTISYSNVVTLIYSNSDDNGNNISVYPNPATSTINLTILKNNDFKQNNIELIYNIKIINSYGLTVKTATFSQTSWKGDIGNLMPGTYFIQVINNNNDKSIIGINKFIKL